MAVIILGVSFLLMIAFTAFLADFGVFMSIFYEVSECVGSILRFAVCFMLRFFVYPINIRILSYPVLHS